jgi:hypothetical protein
MMPRYRVTIAGAMTLVLGSSLGLAALRHASETIANLVILATLLALSLAVLALIYRRGARRAFWVGFALLGWGYMVWAAEFWWDPAIQRPGPITTGLLEELYPRLHYEASAAGGSLVGRLFRDPDPSNRAIWAKLDAPLAMPFSQETPLEDVLRYIKNATKSPEMPGGIPMYLDPAGLTEAEKTPASSVSVSLDGVPLRTTLRLMLDQLGLRYEVKDGVLTITSKSSSSASSSPALAVFTTVGHCLIALLAACLGGIAGRVLYATRDEANP